MTDAEVLAELGARMRASREALGLIQQEVSVQAGFNRAYLSFMELGRRNPGVLTVVRVASVLGVDPAEWFKGLSPGVGGLPARPR